MYLEAGAERVARASFYDGFGTPLENVMAKLRRRAVEYAAAQPRDLPAFLGCGNDWCIADEAARDVHLPGRWQPRCSRRGLSLVARRIGLLLVFVSGVARTDEGGLSPVTAARAVETPLSRRADGSRFVERGTFAVDVSDDGAIHIRDKPAFQVHAPCLSCIRGHFAAWLQDPKANCGFLIGDLLPTFGGGFDLTDLILRAHGVDPYAFAKLRVIDRTGEARAALALEDRRERLRRAIVELPRRLTDIWSDRASSATEKRALLFELWDDTDGEDGREARAIIEGFIRRQLPRGSALGYPHVELDALNGRRESTVPFAP
jgi:hypothetical protein